MQYPVRTGPFVNDQAPFGPEMIAGNAPHRPRLFLGPNKVPFPMGDASFTPAPISIEMLAGWQPLTQCIKLGQKIPLPYVDNPIAAPFTIDMVIGNKPDRHRITFGKQIPLPDSQLTHVNAPFGQEMVMGWQPPRFRQAPLHYQTPPIVETPSYAFPTESTFGSHPDTPRLVRSSAFITSFFTPPFDGAIAGESNITFGVTLEYIMGGMPSMPNLGGM